MLKKGDLEYLKRNGEEKALAKMALACAGGKGVRLSWKEAREIFGMDDALHARLQNELERQRPEAHTRDLKPDPNTPPRRYGGHGAGADA